MESGSVRGGVGIMVKTEIKVGLFIILSALLILSGLGYMAFKKGLFQAEQTVTLSSRTGDGLTVGMPLIFSGFKIGKITDLELDAQGLVQIKIRIPSQHLKWLRTDSKFILERPLIGSTKLLVVTTNMSSAPLTSKSIPMVNEVNDINETIKKFEPVLVKIALITDHVEKLTGNLAGKKSLIEMAVNDPDSIQAIHEALKSTRSITQRTDGLLKKTEEELYGPNGIKPAVTQVLQEVVVNLQKVGKTLDNVTKISSDAAASTKDLKLLRSEIDATVNSINHLVDEINKKIPFRSEPEIRLP